VAKLEFSCPMCNGTVETSLDTAGEMMACPHCTKAIRAPSPQGNPAVTRTIVQTTPTSGLAIWSFILALFSILCFGIFTGLPAVICGHLALGRIRSSAGTLGGQGLAMAGLVIAYISIGLWTLYLLLFGGLAFLGSLAEMSG